MLRALELQNIRSYTNGLFEFKAGVNIIVGPNASGKTNLLESIHMMAQGSGFKSDDNDMVRRGSSWGRIDASVNEDVRVVKLAPDLGGKSFIINDVEKKRLSTNTLLPVVLFEPGHMLLLGGEPERRRSYIDTVIMQIEPSYRRDIQSYKRALTQRNKLLKQESVAPEHIFVWDLRLSELSGVIVKKRTDYIQAVRQTTTERYRSISGNKEHIDLFYESKLSPESYAQSHLKQLKDDFALDRLRGFTGSGPHRDDIAVHIDGVEARLSASRGETRNIVLALKLIEMDMVFKKTGQKPLLLLDDVFSELDGRRRRLLAQTLTNVQSFITTTDADAIVKSFLEDYNIITTQPDE